MAELTAVLKDRDTGVRARACAALTRLDRKTAPVAVMVALLEQRPARINDLADTLIALGADAGPVVPALLKALRHDDRSVHLAAARVLRKIDADVAAKAGVP